MSYKNAAQILPPELLREVQKYIDGDFLYIPRLAPNRRTWGSGTATRQELEDRNKSIYSDYINGMRYHEMAEKYFLSRKSIERVVTGMRKKNKS